MRSATSKTSGMLWLIMITAAPDWRTRIISLQHHLRLAHAEGGRGLVHDHHFVAPGRGPRHGDRLALTTGECEYRLPHCGQAYLQAGHLLGGSSAHGAVVEEANLPQGTGDACLAAEKEVRGDVEMGRESQILKYSLDAVPARILRRMEDDRPSFQQHSAAVRLQSA